ncbi:HupE/UreJ family protein, partial [Mycobacterium tuberculosis]|nr:HupE/UreJ family protein [Mycobacterium tuberculosis]
MFSVLLICLIIGSHEALAHAVTAGDKGYIQEISGVNILPFMYLGAKHMITGYDHIPFLFGVISFLSRMTHIGVYQ